MKIDYDVEKVMNIDDMSDVFNYKMIIKVIIKFVEDNCFFFLEKFIVDVLSIVVEYFLVCYVEVEVDKLYVFRFFDFVFLMLFCNKMG